MQSGVKLQFKRAGWKSLVSAMLNKGCHGLQSDLFEGFISIAARCIYLVPDTKALDTVSNCIKLYQLQSINQLVFAKVILGELLEDWSIIIRFNTGHKNIIKRVHNVIKRVSVFTMLILLNLLQNKRCRALLSLI